MKRNLTSKHFIISLLVVMSSCVPHNKPKQSKEWIDPNSTVCVANGGKIEDHICYATWQNANKICQASGGKLPSLDTMTQLIKECGGVVADYNFFSRGGAKELVKREEQNKNNASYQQCYKAQGFSEDTGYWSAKKYIPQSQGAWFVRFKEGTTGVYQMAAEYAIRCKK